MRSRTALAVVLVTMIGLLSAVGGATWSAFSSSTGTTATVTAKRIFTGPRTWEPRDFRDASNNGTEADVSEALSFGDAKTVTTGNWPNLATGFVSTRYVDFNFASNLPAGVPLTGMTFVMQFATNGGGADTGCIYVEVRRSSTGALVETVPSNAPTSNAGCVTATESTLSVPLNGLTTSDVANDLRIRVIGYESGAKPYKINRAVVTGSLYSSAFTISPYWYDERADGTPTYGIWPLTADGDSASLAAGAYTNTTTWSATFGAKYLKFTYPTTMVPTGATVTGATFNYSVRGATAGDNICYYFEVYSGATLVTTKGAPLGICSNAVTYTQVNTAIPEINTPALANGAIIKMFVKDTSGNRKSSTELATLSVTYALN